MLSTFFFIGCIVYLVNFCLLAARKLILENQLRHMIEGLDEKIDISTYQIMLDAKFDDIDQNRYIDLFFISIGTLATGLIFGVIGYFVTKFL
tara:strand:- start:274 stop:549 length:276 start_codon:yes stop_codon:yes gene_type:complete